MNVFLRRKGVTLYEGTLLDRIGGRPGWISNSRFRQNREKWF